MKKLVMAIITMFLLMLNVDARAIKHDLTTVLNDSLISKNSVSIAVINADNGKSVYNLNEKILFHPASVQKLMTIVPASKALGDDYEFRTKLFLRDENTYVIKLGADPYLSYGDLEYLVNKIDKTKIRKLYIDDSIIEKKDWGEGWQWDDDLNTYMPRFNAYNLDGNLVSVTIMPAVEGKPSFIINPSRYPIIFFNNLVQGSKNDVKVSRENSVSANSITLTGTINSPVTITIPISNLQKYFTTRLIQALESKEIYLKASITTTLITSSDKEIASVGHKIQTAQNDILKNSNNLVSETLSKVASSKAYSQTGTDILGIKLFEEYCNTIGLDPTDIRIVDACGVSKNNIVSADFITRYLYKNKDCEVFDNMATPGTGTLTNRMLPLKDNLKAKTGTLSDISSIAGFLTSKSGKHYVFCIIINDPKSTESDKKLLEDYLIRDMYINL